MYLLKSIIRKSQMSLDFSTPTHEEERTVHASTRHLQSGTVVQVGEHHRKMEVAGQQFTTYKEAMAHVDRQRRRIKGYLGSDEYHALYPHIKELEQREKNQAKQQESEWRRIGKYPDGRLVPKLGDKVFIVTGGMLGTSASIQGEVYQAKNGNYRVKVTATHAMMGGEASAKDYPLTPEWTVRNDPELTRREEARKQKEQYRIAQADREHQKWLQKQTGEYQTALARGEQPVKPEEAREGDVLNYYDGFGEPRKVEVRKTEEWNDGYYVTVSDPGPLDEDGYYPGDTFTLNRPDFDGGETPRVTRYVLHKSMPMTHLLRKSHKEKRHQSGSTYTNKQGTTISRQDTTTTKQIADKSRFKEGGTDDLIAMFQHASDMTVPRKQWQGVIYGHVSKETAKAVKNSTGLNIRNYRHAVEMNGMVHISKRHGLGREEAQALAPITQEDIAKIPEIVANPDAVTRGRSESGSPTILYSKKFETMVFYVEEMQPRQGLNLLVAKTMYKHVAPALRATSNDGDAQTSETFRGSRPATKTGPMLDDIKIADQNDLRKSISHLPALIKAHKLHGHIAFHGLDISVENRMGSIRQWKDPHNSESGMTRMKRPYGYIKGTLGQDGDHYDVFVGPHRDAPNVFIVSQMKAPDFTEHDEEKALIGFLTEAEATEFYHLHYNDPRFLGKITVMPFEEFKAKVMRTRNNPSPLAKPGIRH